MDPKVTISLLPAVAIILSEAIVPGPSYSEANRFFCGLSGGVPTTQATTNEGKTVSVIRWTSNVFDDAGWNPEHRCQEVSSRFESLRQQGKLKYLTTGRINGQPVICSTTANGGACDGLLYTLKPNQDPTQTLQKLLDVRVKATGPLNETNSRLYVSIDEILQTTTNNENQIIPSSPLKPTSSGLW
jgi:hypothetical protein